MIKYQLGHSLIAKKKNVIRIKLFKALNKLKIVMEITYLKKKIIINDTLYL